MEKPDLRKLSWIERALWRRNHPKRKVRTRGRGVPVNRRELSELRGVDPATITSQDIDAAVNPQLREIWATMIRRCEDPRFGGWRYYGGRGIRVADSWKQNFHVFAEHIGPRPSPEHSIDRIDNDGHYEPGNVRWATRQQQVANQRRPKKSAG